MRVSSLFGGRSHGKTQALKSDMNVSYIKSEKVGNGNVRVHFKYEGLEVDDNPQISFKGFMKSEWFFMNGKVYKDKDNDYVDVPIKTYNHTTYFDCVVERNGKRIWTGTFTLPRISHWVTKKLVPETRRVFFKFEIPEASEVLLTFKGLLGVHVYSAQVDFKADHHWFYIDVPWIAWGKTKSFECIVHQSKNTVIWNGSFEDSGKFENLYEGKK